MKKIMIVLSLGVMGCSYTADRFYPHYPATPTITQKIDDPVYWVSVSKAPPTYPNKALVNGLEGCAKIGFTITPDGIVADPFVMKSFPGEAFDISSMNAIVKFRFKPSATNSNLEPVLSSNVFTYVRAGNPNKEQLSKKCE